MNALDPTQAVRRVETNRATAFAFEVVGHVTAADVENLYGLLEGAYALHDKIDLLLRVVDFEGVEWDDVSTDTTRETRSHALEHIRRCAVVGEANAIRQMSSFFTPRATLERRNFDAGDEAAAWEWIGAKPA